MIDQIIQYVAGILIIIGSAFCLLAAIGVLRFPDLYTRMHAATKAGTVGAGFVLLAIAVASLDASVALRALAGLGFLILTAPVAAHLLARAAYSAGYQPSPATTVNDLSNESTRNRSI
jgi:multicomponent Na+:H+ antiporter subunit G